MWLVDQVTGDLADALDRDLRTDRLAFGDLDWRGLWAYVTAAPPGTALHYARSQGWALGDKLAAEQLHALRNLHWHYRARNFVGGADAPFPEPVDYPGRAEAPKPDPASSWATASVDDIVSPQVRALLMGA